MRYNVETASPMFMLACIPSILRSIIYQCWMHTEIKMNQLFIDSDWLYEHIYISCVDVMFVYCLTKLYISLLSSPLEYSKVTQLKHINCNRIQWCPLESLIWVGHWGPWNNAFTSKPNRETVSYVGWWMMATNLNIVFLHRFGQPMAIEIDRNVNFNQLKVVLLKAMGCNHIEEVMSRVSCLHVYKDEIAGK